MDDRETRTSREAKSETWGSVSKGLQDVFSRDGPDAEVLVCRDD